MSERSNLFPLDELIPVSINISTGRSCGIIDSNGFKETLKISRRAVMEAYIADWKHVQPLSLSGRSGIEFFRVDSERIEWWLDFSLVPYEAFVEHRHELNLVRCTMHGIGIEHPHSLVDKTRAVLSIARTARTKGNCFLKDVECKWDKISSLWNMEEPGVIGPFGSENGVEQYCGADLTRDEARGILHSVSAFLPHAPSCEIVKSVSFSSCDSSTPAQIAMDTSVFYFLSGRGDPSWLRSMLPHAEHVGFDLGDFYDVFRIEQQFIDKEAVRKCLAIYPFFQTKKRWLDRVLKREIIDEHENLDKFRQDVVEQTNALYLSVARKGVSQ